MAPQPVTPSPPGVQASLVQNSAPSTDPVRESRQRRNPGKLDVPGSWVRWPPQPDGRTACQSEPRRCLMLMSFLRHTTIENISGLCQVLWTVHKQRSISCLSLAPIQGCNNCNVPIVNFYLNNTRNISASSFLFLYLLSSLRKKEMLL